MKKYLRAGLCGMLLGLTLCGTAAAVQPEQTVSVRLNGQMVQFADGVKVVDGRTYLPFRGVFQTLGFEDSEITFDSGTRTVRAHSPDLTVSMVIGEKRMRVTQNGKTQILSVDAPAFLDPVLGRAYVPARFVAEAAECRLGWDQENRTVILDDVEKLLAENQESYTILEAYLAFTRNYQTKNYDVRGSYTAEASLGADHVALKGRYSMLMDNSGLFELEMPVKLEGSISGLDLPEEVTDDLYLSARGDRAEQTHYLHIGKKAGSHGEEGEWLTLNRQFMAEGRFPAQAANCVTWLNPDGSSQWEGTGRDYVNRLVYETAQAQPSVPASEILERINGLLGDSSFQRGKEGYVSQWTQEHIRIKLCLQHRRENIVGYALEILQEPARRNAGVELYTQLHEQEWDMTVTLVEQVGQYLRVSMDGTLEETMKRPEGYLPG